ncbi:hypothetical protein UFOVP1138_17 [uncultured Caudovirales phage]|uniref:Uncharacterized protein n=1 Tax=uncultured Caudovirales phage TaxID=2100421 RepID=A0A6J5S768_9CAUD|nr:hypothetical protein UFOVP975_14 [uncultured Caudovirales phage]CAB4186187.1 hypothetical protein UFOVP1138_17 [uncultured Caudovirales phage]CAB4204394.1 hypothetical protein UFOVP1394_14 [uncultured Caudovirales phage]
MITYYDIIIGLVNKCSYDEFSKACIAIGFPIQNPIDFAMTVGMVLTAIELRKDLSPIDAVSYLIGNNIRFIKSVTFSNEPQVHTSGCCGGGEVL